MIGSNNTESREEERLSGNIEEPRSYMPPSMPVYQSAPHPYEPPPMASSSSAASQTQSQQDYQSAPHPYAPPPMAPSSSATGQTQSQQVYQLAPYLYAPPPMAPSSSAAGQMAPSSGAAGQTQLQQVYQSAPYPFAPPPMASSSSAAGQTQLQQVYQSAAYLYAPPPMAPSSSAAGQTQSQQVYQSAPYLYATPPMAPSSSAAGQTQLQQVYQSAPYPYAPPPMAPSSSAIGQTQSQPASTPFTPTSQPPLLSQCIYGGVWPTQPLPQYLPGSLRSSSQPRGQPLAALYCPLAQVMPCGPPPAGYLSMPPFGPYPSPPTLVLALLPHQQQQPYYVPKPPPASSSSTQNRSKRKKVLEKYVIFRGQKSWKCTFCQVERTCSPSRIVLHLTGTPSKDIIPCPNISREKREELKNELEEARPDVDGWDDDNRKRKRKRETNGNQPETQDEILSTSMGYTHDQEGEGAYAPPSNGSSEPLVTGQSPQLDITEMNVDDETNGNQPETQDEILSTSMGRTHDQEGEGAYAPPSNRSSEPLVTRQSSQLDITGMNVDDETNGNQPETQDEILSTSMGHTHDQEGEGAYAPPSNGSSEPLVIGQSPQLDITGMNVDDETNGNQPQTQDVILSTSLGHTHDQEGEGADGPPSNGSSELLVTEQSLQLDITGINMDDETNGNQPQTQDEMLSTSMGRTHDPEGEGADAPPSNGSSELLVTRQSFQLDITAINMDDETNGNQPQTQDEGPCAPPSNGSSELLFTELDITGINMDDETNRNQPEPQVFYPSMPSPSPHRLPLTRRRLKKRTLVEKYFTHIEDLTLHPRVEVRPRRNISPQKIEEINNDDDKDDGGRDDDKEGRRDDGGRDDDKEGRRDDGGWDDDNRENGSSGGDMYGPIYSPPENYFHMFVLACLYAQSCDERMGSVNVVRNSEAYCSFGTHKGARSERVPRSLSGSCSLGYIATFLDYPCSSLPRRNSRIPCC